MIDFLKYEDSKNTEVFPQGKLFRVKYDSSMRKMRLICYNSSDLQKVINAFSDVNPSSFFMKQYGYSVPQRISVINNFGYFDAGLIFEVLTYIKTIYGSLSVVAFSENCKTYLSDFVTPLKKIINGNSFDISNISDDSGKNKEKRDNGEGEYQFRDYQENAIHELLFNAFGRGLVELPTSSGKSFMLCNLIHNIKKNIYNDVRVLLLVPNKQLVSQMYNDFKDYGMNMSNVTKFTAGLKKNEQYNADAQIIIANRQFVFTNKSLLPNIDVLICDEVHSCLSEATENFIKNLNCKMRMGCTGTIPKVKYDRLKLIGLFGKICYKEDITDLQKRGFISKLKITQINIKDTVVENDRNYLFNLHPLRKYSPDENGYSEIAFNAAHEAEHKYYASYYKELYTPVIKYLNDLDENILILFDRIEVGQRLKELAEKICDKKNIHYIDGSIDIKERLRITDSMENSGNNIIFAENAVFSTGISIKRLTHIVFMCSFKSFTRTIQSIGRTLRLHKTKDYAHLIDVSMNFKYSRKHLLERLNIYKEVYNKTPDEILNFEI